MLLCLRRFCKHHFWLQGRKCLLLFSVWQSGSCIASWTVQSCRYCFLQTGPMQHLIDCPHLESFLLPCLLLLVSYGLILLCAHKAFLNEGTILTLTGFWILSPLKVPSWFSWHGQHFLPWKCTEGFLGLWNYGSGMGWNLPRSSVLFLTPELPKEQLAIAFVYFWLKKIYCSIERTMMHTCGAADVEYSSAVPGLWAEECKCICHDTLKCRNTVTWRRIAE